MLWMVGEVKLFISIQQAATLFGNKFKMKNPGKAWITTKNPCNEFLVDYMIQVRKNAQKTNNDRRFIIYSVAMNSIKRYPLPIICKSQLRNLHGLGDVICDELTKVIRDYYKNYLN